MSFAKGTEVPVERTRAQIEQLVLDRGATGFMSAFMVGPKGHFARLQWQLEGRMFRFDVALPPVAEFKRHPRSTWREVSDTEAERKMHAEHRRLWRALLLGIKAKFELAASGIESLERVFLAQIVTHDGGTVADSVLPQIAEMYETGRVGPLLLGSGGTR